MVNEQWSVNYHSFLSIAPVQVQCVLDSSEERGRGASDVWNVQGMRGEGDASVPSQVGHPHKAHHSREG